MKMTKGQFKEALKTAINTRNYREIGSMTEYMRFSLGMNYHQTFDLVSRLIPSMDLPTWDEILYEVDNLDTDNPFTYAQAQADC